MSADGITRNHNGGRIRGRLCRLGTVALGVGIAAFALSGTLVVGAAQSSAILLMPSTGRE